ncbi:hypothetical protein P280DRAFT_471890 [Massarina eburnea CBS 473.64]|uniref:Uncharacterized protein n=1 Tax=Massarina eburnea CBS 473.64 TaxID=1395130 RepID=A0A6A6RTZ1_9PLEO|nr:hypothetical protein P280DRAFT_471890 [Massarina eburnea CBS 473.64]
MAQNVAWLRGGLLEIHDLALSIKREGDRAFAAGNVDMAQVKYDDTRSFLKAALQQNTMMQGIDADLGAAIERLNIIVWTDTALILLSDMMLTYQGLRRWQEVVIFSNTIENGKQLIESTKKPISLTAVLTRYYYLLGIAELGLGRPNKAGKAFAKAYKIISEPRTKEGWEAAKAWPTLSKDDQKNRLNTILSHMPKKPLVAPEMKNYSAPQVASEHWVMRELGFKGPIPYEDKITGTVGICMTAKPHPNFPQTGLRTAQVGLVKEEVLREQVEMRRKQLNTSYPNGNPVCWVALGLDMIGEESIFDDPVQVRELEESIKKMRDLFG